MAPKVDVAVSEKLSGQGSTTNLALFSIAFSCFLILYLLLGQISKNYRRQVLDLVDTMNLRSSQGESERRIDTSTKDQNCWLLVIWSIPCSDNMDENIRDIYTDYELSQKRYQ